MGKYCCFFCPAKDYSEKSLDDTCPTCGRPFGFVLTSLPKEIRDFRITKQLGRGFYGAAYIAERGAFNKKQVIKISPTSFYSFFGKPAFADETALHAKLAAGSAHIVDIDDAFEQEVTFSDAGHTPLKCYVTVLDFVDGKLLREYVDGEVPSNAASVCQIAIDLLRIRSEFEAHQLNHNDLHAENLIVEQLRPEARRPDAIGDTIRVKAIDLGSISDDSKSSDSRDGDLLLIAKHLNRLLDRLLWVPSAIEDRDFRVSLALQRIVHGLVADAQNQRHPNSGDLIEQIRHAYYRAAHHWQPWNIPLALKGFGDHYNAQTLESWDVPRLLVDPENRWIAEVTKPGPQIITGMRGCGKTMLLRALDIHARAAKKDDESSDDVLRRIEGDRFVGLFVSAQRLLDLREQSLYKLEHRLTILFVNYALQAARGLLHLESVDKAALAPGAYSTLANAVADYLEGADELRRAVSLEDLEAKLLRIVVLTSKEERYSVKQAPAVVFSHLAENLRLCAEKLNASSVFYLLDDVSTRYLEIDKIEGLLSALLFQSPTCAFKFTSEWQTIELGLQSPGRNHPIRVDRDLAVFDLGADVFQTINASGTDKGNKFVERILLQRANVHVSHPPGRGPRELLGDVTLEQVAREIASSNKTSKQRKQVYRGVSCLTSVCVGDIGDIIKLYEEIMRRAVGKKQNPISDEIQSDCFQDMCSRRLYDLNRRNSLFKNHALAFASAAHELLVRSYKLASDTQKETPRLRQYSSIYVRITSDDANSQKKQIDLLRELIDAGVFVYAGGSRRTKTKDSNPIQQFKLSFRKIYGLAAFIGLSDRDRFELSGTDLEEWLEKPASGKEILLRNQINDEVDAQIAASQSADQAKSVDASTQAEAEEPKGSAAFSPKQRELFQEEQNVVASDLTRETRVEVPAMRLDISIETIPQEALANVEIGGLLTGLGFEDRTLASNKFLSKFANPPVVHAVKYALAGNEKKILALWKKAKRKVAQCDYATALVELPTIEGLALIDISGLSTPLIFKAIRRELIEKGRVLVCRASAKHYYPLQEDIGRLFAQDQSQEPIQFLENLANVLKGETGPYKENKLLEEQTDPSRSRALLAFASAKHERLFTLLDKREFDYLEVIVPAGSEPRAKVAMLAAQFLCQNYPNAKVTQVDTSDLVGLVRYLDGQFLDIYGDAGANLEIGLTGSKIQVVAAAILSARRKIAQAWYLSPKQFDEKRFSKGVGEVTVFDIRSADSRL